MEADKMMYAWQGILVKFFYFFIDKYQVWNTLSFSSDLQFSTSMCVVNNKGKEIQECLYL